MQHPFEHRNEIKVVSRRETAPQPHILHAVLGLIVVSLIILGLNLSGAAGYF